MIIKHFYRWIVLTIILTFLLTVFGADPSHISLAQEKSELGTVDQQEGLTAFQRTHAQLVQESRATGVTRENGEYTPRYSLADVWKQACNTNAETRAVVPDGFCEALDNGNIGSVATRPGNGRMIENPNPNMMTTTNAWESYDLDYMLNTYGSIYTPPDTMGAVGATQFAVIQNGLYRFHDKLTGAPDLALDVLANAFWPASVDPGDDAGGDPRVRYDRLTDQWVISAFTRTSPNRVVVARSDGPIVSLATVWTFWYLDPGSTIGGAIDANCFVDYPMLGVDNNAIMIGGNIFPDGTCTAPGPLGADTTVWVMPKATLPPSGGDASSTTYAFPNLLDPCTPSECIWSPMPADNYESLANSYIIGRNIDSWDAMQIGTVTWVGSVPALSWTTIPTNIANEGDFTLGVPYPGVPAPNGSTTFGLDPIGFRVIGGAHVRNGNILVSLSNSVDGPTGTLVVGPGNGDRHSALVFEIDVNTHAIVQEFNIYDTVTPLGSQPENYWMPSAMYNGQGHIVVGFSATDPNGIAPSGAYATQLNSDPINTFNTPVVYMTGTNTGDVRNLLEFNPRPTRWGDYSMTTVDPCDDMTVYTIQEYQDAPATILGGNWAVTVAQISAPPLTVSGGTPDPIPFGSASEVVSVTGTGLYDTPSHASAFCRTRLEATTTYPGLSINSVTYNNETSMDIDFDTSGAACGTATVTVTNPDGQFDTFTIEIGTLAQCSGSNQITIDDPVVTEGSGGSFTVSINPTSTDTTDVTFTVADGTATGSGTDYTVTTSSPVTIPANTSSVTINFTTNDDAIFEGSEDFVVNLTGATNGTDAVVIADPQGTATINDNDSQPEISISPATVTHDEGDAGTTDHVFTVTLSNASTQTVSVDYTTNDGTATTADSDYVDNDNTLTFNSGGTLTQDITVQVNGDTQFEPNEDFTVTLNSATNGTIDGANDTSTGNITNDDVQPDNDLFVNATDLGTLPATTSQTVLNATISGTDPSLWCVADYTDSVWFSFTATADQLVTVDSDTSNFDTVLGSFTGTEGNLAVIACDDNGGTGSTSSLSFSTKSGVTYYIMAAQVGTVPVVPGADSLTINVGDVSRNDAVVLFDPATQNTGMFDTMLNSPNEFAYVNTPPTSTAPEWVMGDWNGDGVRTPGIFDGGAFVYTNDIGPSTTWSAGMWLGNAPGRVKVISGRFASGFANDTGNDCIGWMDSNTSPVTGDLRFSLKWWCDMTATGVVILNAQWLGSPLPDSGGFTGTHQWIYGDWDSDGFAEPGVRRGGRIARGDAAPFEGAAFFGTGAQRWDTADGDGPGAHGLNAGDFVAGDWNNDGQDSWGVVYADGEFYYRDDISVFNPGPYEFQLQTFVSGIAFPRQVDSHWAATGGTSAPGPAGPTIVRLSENDDSTSTGGNFDTSRNVEAELSVGKSGSYQVGEVGLVGDSIVWTIIVSNTGTAPAKGVQITDNVPAELRVDDVLSDNGTITIRGQSIIFTTESIGVGETVQFQVVTTILNQPTSGTFANSVNVILPDGNGSGSDANLVASGSVSSVDGLPATGYAPKFRW